MTRPGRASGAGPILLPLVGIVLAGLTWASAARAQERPPLRPPAATPRDVPGQPISSTVVQFELLSDARAGSTLAQDWGRMFAQMGISLRIRRPVLDDQPKLDETVMGTLRTVTAVGALDQSGRLVFPGKTFRRDEIGKLKEWIRELETFGVQGSPEGQPRYGLSKSQYGAVHDALRPPLEAEVAGLSLEAALARFELPATLPLTWSVDAKGMLRQRPEQVVRQTVTGFSQGQALSILLGEFGLGFRPRRTPQGSLELAIAPLKAVAEHWPVGFGLHEKQLTRVEAAPEIFRIVPVNLEDLPFVDVLAAITKATGLPILVDDHSLAEMGIELQSLRVNYPFRRTSWNSLLQHLAFREKLAHVILVDENQKPFVWITTIPESFAFQLEP